MNKIYRVVWNEAILRWDVVSELTGTKKKSKSSRVSTFANSFFLTGLLALSSNLAVADVAIELNNNWRPETNNNFSGAVLVSGSTENISGPSSVAANGSGAAYLTIEEAKEQGYVLGGDDLFGLSYINLGDKTKTIVVKDEITGANKTIQVFDDALFSERAAGSASNETVSVFTPNASFFYKTRLVTATNGGTANISVGANFLGSYWKDSQLAVADGADSKVNWTTQNDFYIGAAATTSGGVNYNKSINSGTYAGSFVDFNGNSYTVNSLADFQKYNQYLIDALTTGKINPSEYDTEINKATIKTTHDYDVDRTAGGTIDKTPYEADTGLLAILLGANNGTATLTKTGKLTGVLPSYGHGAGIVAQTGGIGINEGIIDAVGVAMSALADSTVINNGTLYVWDNNTRFSRQGDGMLAINRNAKAINNGVINIRPFKTAAIEAEGNNVGMSVSGQGSGINNGRINITADASTIDNKGKTVGVRIGKDGTFTNAAQGKITVGLSEDGVKTHSAIDSTAIEVQQGAAQVVNEGLILLGDGAQGNYGISVLNAGEADVTNKGIITIEGRDSDTPALNVGMYANNSTGLKNDGVINVNGINSSGVLIKNSGGLHSSGTINVGGLGVSSGFRNYGVWVEGQGSKAEISGRIKLNGVGAVGVLAKDGGSMTVSGAGSLEFGNTDQIGFYVYGESSVIYNDGSGVMDVSTDKSTLFRVANGASFKGGLDASSALTASGSNSFAVIATGKSDNGVNTLFRSGGMTLNLSGVGATGVVIEGGAEGIVENNTIINMNNASSIAGIADGNGYDILGNLINPNDASTKLTASAKLSSSQDKITGYIARNGATLNNAGDISFTGRNTVGVRVEEGAVGENSGNITVQDGGVGLISEGKLLETIINNDGNLVLKGGGNDNRTVGIKASGAHASVNMNSGIINLEGQGAIGIEVSEQGSVNLNGTGIPQFAEDGSGITDQIAFRIVGGGATLRTNVAKGTLLDSSGERSVLFRIEDGGSQRGSLQMKTSGTSSRGIWATGKGSEVLAESGSDFQILGAKAQGVYITGGATGTIKQGVSVNLVGDGAVVAEVDGNEYALDNTIVQKNTGSTMTSEADITTNLSNAKGFIARNQGLFINSGNIDFTQGTDNVGIWVDNGQFENTGNRIAVNGVALFVEGEGSRITSTGGDIVAVDGEAAIKLGAGASLNLAGSGLGTVEGQKNAHGILLDTGSVGLVVDGAKINVNAEGAIGHGIENRAEIEGIQLTGATVINVADGIGIRTGASLAKTNSGTVNVDGSGIGLAFQNEDSSETDHNLDMSDSTKLVINLNGTGGTGVLVNTKDGSLVKSGTSVNVNQADGGIALVVHNAAAEVVQSGNLTSSSLTNMVVDAYDTLSFINKGQINAAATDHDAMVFNDIVNTMVINDSNAEIQGVVSLGGGNNTFINKGNIYGTVSAKDGDNTLLFDNDSLLTEEAVLGNGNNQITFNGKADVTKIVAGAGRNTITIQGEGATFDLLDGGQGDSDSLIFDAATHTIDQARKLKNIESVQLKNSSKVTMNEALVLTDDGANAGSVDIDAGSELSINPKSSGDFIFDPLLTGEGVLSAQLDANTSEFSFSKNAGDQFSGTLKLGTSSFELGGQNTASLTKAMLMLGTDNVTTIGDGVQHIGGLGFRGGKLVFDTVSPGDKVASNSIETATDGVLDIRNQGTIQIAMPSEVVNDIPAIDTRKNLLEQDDEQTLIMLVNAKGTVLGTGGQIELVDETGQVISNSQVFDVIQAGDIVAQGTYDYKLLSSSNGVNSDGLYIGYGLKALDLQGMGDKALVLAPRANAQGLESDLGAQLTGTGDIAIEAGRQVVTLSHGGNSYTGDTLVRSGTLKMANDNVLGQTTMLVIDKGAIFKTDGYSQIVGALSTQSGSSLQLDADSVLTIDASQRQAGEVYGGIVENGVLSGSGVLVVNDSSLIVNGSNVGFTGDSKLSGGALVEMEGAQGLGNQGVIQFESLNDKLNINMAKGSGLSGNLSKQLSGEGFVSVLNTTDLKLSGDNSNFNGEFHVGAGAALRASAPEHLGAGLIDSSGTTYLTANTPWTLTNDIKGNGALIKDGSDKLIINRDMDYTGDTTVNRGSLIIGDAGDLSGSSLSGSQNVHVLSNAVLSGRGEVTGAVNNHGTLASLNAMPGYEKESAGPFSIGGITNTGTIQLAGSKVGNTLIVNGDYAGGGKLVINTVLADDDSKTDKLIVTGSTSGKTDVMVNNVQGSGAQTINGIEVIQVDGHSKGEFTLGNRVATGAYEYFLHKDGIDTADGNWYLRSELPVEPNPEPKPPVDGNKVLRPEAGSYVANLAAAQTMFNHRLEDREGLQRDKNGIWVRISGSQTKQKDSSGQLNMKTNTYILQAGRDLQEFHFGEASRLDVGVMLAYGEASSKTYSGMTGYHAKGKVTGFTPGVYATWHQNGESQNGGYIDSWLQYSWLKADVQGKQLAKENYRLEGFGASVEAGYEQVLLQDLDSRFLITPQAQMIWNGVKADSLIETKGTKVRSDGHNNIQTRLGVQLAHERQLSSNQNMKMYGALNWLHNSKEAAAVLDSVEVKQNDHRNLGEIKLGLEGELNKQVNVWGNIAYQFGQNSYKDTALKVGVKYHF